MQHTCFRLKRSQEKSACRVSFILALHVKTALIQYLRKADCGGASLKFAIFRHFVPKSNRPKDSNSSKIHLIGVDTILQKHHIRSIEECLSLIYKSLFSNLYFL